MILRAGFALKMVGSLVKGLMPLRALVAGFLMTTNLAKAGQQEGPGFLELLVTDVRERLDDALDVLSRQLVRMQLSNFLNELRLRHNLCHL
jgi:hypothetical protein